MTMTIHSIANRAPVRVLSILAALALLAGFSLNVRPALALQTLNTTVNYYVNSHSDTHDVNNGEGVCNDASGNCSLRAAIEEANYDHNGSKPVIVNIYLPSGTFPLTSEEPLVVGVGPYKNIIHIYGQGYGRLANATTIDGQSSFFGDCDTQDILNGGSLSISGVKLTGGCAAGGTIDDGVGGAIENAGTLSISSSVITGNSALYGGGGVFNGVFEFVVASSPLSKIKPKQILPSPSTVGMLNITGTDVNNNFTLGWGGGILSQTICEVGCLDIVCIDQSPLCNFTPPATTMTLSNDSIHDNDALIDGGGVYNAGGAGINDTRISTNESFGENLANSGGGVYNAAGSTLDISASKLLSNVSRSDGGGLTNAGAGTPIGVNPANDIPTDITIPGAQATLMRTTVQGNSAVTNGGGIENDGHLWLFQSKILKNTAGAAGAGSLGDGGGIFSSDHLMVTDSTIDGNKALASVQWESYGGGIMATDQTWITGTTITNNSAEYGGGLGYDTTTDFLLFPTQENLQLQSDTIKSNHANLQGGGLFFHAPLTNSLNPSTPPVANVPAQGRANDTAITGNSAGTAGGGVYNDFVNDVIYSGTSSITGNTAPSCPQIEMPCT
jgi:fibronectin-binding autotransporter adhesin